MFSVGGTVVYFFRGILFYILNYIIVPISFISVIYLTVSEREYLSYVEKKDRENKPKFKRMYQDSLKRIKKYHVVLVVLILILLPSWHFFYTEVSHQQMHREIVSLGGSVASMNPVFHSLGPSYNTDKIIDKMEEDRDKWLPGLFDTVVDLNDLTKIPGRLAVYRLKGNRLILTYTYVSPYPIMKAYGFTWVEEGENKTIISQLERTIIFPQDPAASGSMADIY